jgi:hypothetical protein
MISKLHDDGTLAPIDVFYKINELIDVINQLTPEVTAESIAAKRGYLRGTSKTYMATTGNSTAEQDIAATRRFVGNDVEVIGGGEENGHFTGVK